MKLNKSEFEARLARIKTLPAEYRDQEIADLKSAQVVEVDEKGAETPVQIDIVVTDTKAVATEQPGLKAEDIQKMIDASVKALAKPLPTEPVGQPEKPAEGRVWAEAKRVTGALKNFKGTVDGRDASERAFRFGAWALAAVSRSMPSKFHFGKAIDFTENYIAKLHSTFSNTAGGFSVPEEFGRDMIDLREQYGVVRRIFRVRPMTSDTRTDPRRTGGLTACFVGEGQAGTESSKSWDQVSLTAKKLMVISRYTAELNEDSVMNIGDDLAGEISYAFANKEDDCGINGTGTSTYGGIHGLLSRLTTVNGVDDGGSLVLGAGNTWSELTLANFNSVIGRLPQYADTNNTSWLCHRAFYYGVMERLVLAAGGVPAREIRDGNRGRPIFLGYPVEISQVMPATEANSQVACTLGDYSLVASFGDRRMEAIEFSTQASVGGESVFERDEIAIKGTERFDINVHDVGTSTAAGPVVGLITAAS